MALTANPVPDDVFPLSSDKGEAIPLSIVRPLGLVKLDTVSGIPVNVTLPGDMNICSVYCTKDILLTMPDSVLTGDVLSSAMYLLAGIIYELALPAEITFESSEDGLLVINLLQRWAQIKNFGSYQIG